MLNILNHVSLEIFEKEFVGIMGVSGSGKSTLLNLIEFLDKEFKGEYFFEDTNIQEFSDNTLSKVRNKNVGFIFQNFSLIEPQNVGQNVTLP